MKNILKLGVFALAAAALAVGCDDAEYNEGGKTGDSLGVHAFFAESIKTAGIANSSVKLTLEQGAKVTLTPSLTDKIGENCVLRMVMDQSVLDKFNNDQGTSFQMLPEQFVDFGEDIVIPAGKYAADASIINIKSITANEAGMPLAIPIRLEKVSGNVEIADNTASYVIEVKSPLVNDLAQFRGAAGLWVNNFEQTFDNWTIEMKLQVANTGNRNRDIFCTINDGEMMFRFEDPQSSNGLHKAHSLVQFQGVGDYLNPSLSIQTNKWQHYAVTFDGTKVTIFVNGVNAGSKEITKSVVKNGYFKYLTFMGIGGSNGQWGPGDSWWWGCNTMCTECRIWSVARTEDQIAKNMASVTPTTKGLEGYWRVNKATWNADKKEFADLTGNNHPMTTEKVFLWNTGISSEAESSPWQ